MILGRSLHPVYLKKIFLRTWKLRDEMEASLGVSLSEESLSQEEAVARIRSYYQALALTNPSLANNPAGDSGQESSEVENSGSSETDSADDEEDSSVLDMAAAMAESDETEEEGEDEDDAEALMAQALAEAEGDEESDEESSDEESLGEGSDETSEASGGHEGEAPSNVIPLFKNRQSYQQLRRKFKRIRPAEPLVSEGHTFFSDVNMAEIMIFSHRDYWPGQLVVVEFLIPNSFSLLGKVTYIKDIGIKSRIINNNRPNYRIVIQFEFPRPGDRTILRRFLKSIEPTIKRVAVKKKEKDELDELDF